MKLNIIGIALCLIAVVLTTYLIISYQNTRNTSSAVTSRWSGNNFMITTLSGGKRIDALQSEINGQQIFTRFQEPYFFIDSQSITITAADWQRLLWVDEAGKKYPSPPIGADVKVLYIQYQYSVPSK